MAVGKRSKRSASSHEPNVTSSYASRQRKLMNCINLEATFTLQVTRDGCRFYSASDEPFFTPPWVSLGLTGLGPAAVSIGLRPEELCRRRDEAGSQQTSSSRPCWYPFDVGAHGPRT